MPPRIRSSRFSSLPRPTSGQSSCTRPQCITQSAQTSRQFSQTSCQQVTLRRRKFYAWLNGPGLQLKDPLPDSTNYLGAYDRFGVLIRAGPGYQRGAAKPEENGDAKLTEKKNEAAASTEETEEPSAQAVEVREPASRKDRFKMRDGKNDDSVLEPESIEDLRPFPLNHSFRSQPVLSEDLREAIYQRVKRDGATVSLASVEYGVSNERVGAVVRLKQMEKEWIAQGKTLAMPYSKAVLEMLPTTPYIDPSKPANKRMRPAVHEPINDLAVHPATRQQLWVPVAESRHFTREDAAKAFDKSLLSADERIPHPEMVRTERERAAGLSFEERSKLTQARLAVEEAEQKREEEARQAEIRAHKVVPQRRWDFVFQDVSVESAGRDGRSAKGVGWRYGLPHQDRKKGQVKIPTKVEA